MTLKKAITKKEATKKLADLKKGKGSSSSTSGRRKQARGSLKKDEALRHQNTQKVIGDFVKLFEYELPKDWEKQNKEKNKKGGRPTVMTVQVIRKLEMAFALDCPVEEACIYGGINPSTYYEFIKKEPEFSNTVEVLRNIPMLLARRTIIDGIMNNYSQAMDYASRKKKLEFSHKLELGGGVKLAHDIAPEAKSAVDSIFALFENKAREVAPKFTVTDDDVDEKK